MIIFVRYAVRGLAESRRRWVVAFAVTLLASCDGESIKPGQDRLLSVTIENRQRTFILYVPDRYDANQPPPLLFAFHGTPGNGPGMRRSTHLDDIADKEGWLIAYPNGVDGSWAAGCLCSDVDLQGINDLEFVRRMIGRIRSEYSVDQKRIYSVGFSAGGIMNYRISCDLNDIFAASASVASSMTWAQAETCDPERATSILAMVGTDDPSFPWDGTGTVAGQLMPLDSTFSFWGQANGCSPSPSVDSSPLKDNGLAVREETFEECEGQSEVLRFVIEGGTHVWPSTANTRLQAFFERHTLPQ